MTPSVQAFLVALFHIWNRCLGIAQCVAATREGGFFQFRLVGVNKLENRLIDCQIIF